MNRILILFKTLFAIFFLILLSDVSYTQVARIKDISNLRGFRSNQLTGFGLVTGLTGTGDTSATLIANQAVNNMFTRMGIKPDADVTIPASMAAVLITAELPPFARNGDHFDIRISTLGDATSLAGGTLISTPLKAADGNVYAVAQGGVVTAQATGSGSSPLTVATIPQGATVEKEYISSVGNSGKLVLSLKQADFTTNHRMAEAINTKFQGFFAKSLDAASVEVTIPLLFTDKVPEFISELEGITIQTDQKASVVINERTGTVVIGNNVLISPVAISHGQLTISIGSEDKSASNKKDSKASVANLNGSTVGELVESLNALGVKPADLISIMQAVHAAGAMKADIKIL